MSSDYAGALRFALRSLRRDWRAGELRVLALALMIAVASVTSVGFFTSRVEQVMEQQAGELLAADLVVLSPNLISARLDQEAELRDLETARTLSFASMLMTEEGLQLAEIKAVSDAYPLRGVLRTAPAPFAADEPAKRGPRPGTVWLDPRLASMLGTPVGGTVTVGERAFRISRVLSYEPDRGGDLFSLGPRLMMHVADVPSTGLVQTGSRVRHRLLVAGDPKTIADYRRWLTAELAPGESLQGLGDARPELRMALDRARRFLSLAALVSVVLAGVAVAVATRRYAERHLDSAAIMRCLGAVQGYVNRVFTAQMLLLSLAASLAGCLLGYLAQEGLVVMLAALLPSALPPPSLTPAFTGLTIGMVTLLGFGLPPLIRLRNVSPSRVLRRDLAPLPASSWLVYGSAIGSLALLIYWQAADHLLASYALAGSAAAALMLTLGAALLVYSLGPLRSRVGTAWRFGFASVARHRRSSVTQVVAFGLGIMVLLLLTLVRSDLLETWQQRLPPEAPNYFLINVQADQVNALNDFLARENIEGSGLYPMVRGRLMAIDGRPVSAADYDSPRAQRLMEREFNLSWAAELQEDNQVVAGTWWPSTEPVRQEMSVEIGLAETLGIKLNHELQFMVAGRTVQARVTSLRTVAWDSFRPNFFVIAAPGVLDSYPATFITSFHLPRERHAMLANLVQNFPSVTVLDVDALMQKVRGIMDQAIVAVQYVFVFTLLAGLMVLLAAVQSTLDERRRESAIVRTLGGSRRQLLKGLLAEFVTLGAVAGAVAAFAASGIGLLMADQVFQLDYRPSVWVWLTGVAGGMLGVGLAGTLGTLSVLYHPPVDTLRES